MAAQMKPGQRAVPDSGTDSAASALTPTEYRATVKQLFHEHNRALVNFLLTRVRSKAEAMDLAQDAYVRLLQLDHPGAIGFLRGNNQIKTPLHFVCFEPYVVPKVSLTGDSTERVDTRVLQVIYSFERGNLPIYIGQQMDVYIDASLEHNRELSSFEAPTQP